MRPNAISLLAFLGVAVTSAFADSGDPSDVFLNAYMSFQRGEKAEGRGDSAAAMRDYNQAISQLDQISQRWPTWPPTGPDIVKHRRELVVRALEKLQAKGPANRPDADPLNGAPLPENGAEMLPPENAFPGAEKPVSKPRPGSKNSKGSGGDVLASVQQLKDDLETTREKLDAAEKERVALARKLAEAQRAQKETDDKISSLTKRAELAEKEIVQSEKSGSKNDAELAAMRAEIEKTRKELRHLQFERDAEAEIAEQQADRAKSANQKATNLAAQGAEVPKKIAEMQNQIDAVTKEKAALQARLTNVEKQLAEVSAQRDEYKAELTKLKEASKNIDKLVTDNTQLMAKLSAAEKQVTTLKAEGAQKDETIKQLTADVTSVRKQLAEAQQQSAQYQTQMNELRKQLDVQAKELASVKADATKSAAEREQLAKENNLLRGIVLRAQKTQADKEQTKKLVLEQLAKLNVSSNALSKQIDLLANPVVKLTEAEKKLFKQGSLSISDTEIAFGSPKDNGAAAEAPPTSADDPSKIAAAEVKTPEANEPPPIAAKTETPAPAPTVKTDNGAKIAEANPALPKVDLQPVAEIKTDGPAKTAEPAAFKIEETPLPEQLNGLAIGGSDKSKTLDAPLPEQLSPLAGPGAGKGKDKTLALKQPPGKNGKKGAALDEPELPVKAADGDPIESMPAGPSIKTGSTFAVPPEVMSLARDAKDQFERQNYREAEKIYDKALAKAPNNLYLLSNKGVVLFRSGKFKLAEETFKKAIAIAPEDDFSHCTLGIVQYQQNKLDDAITELTKALAINPKNATAHNYTGITASQKGWQQAALQELQTAVAIDPNYADAHFNLAVIYATQTPPDKEKAREHYKRAIELGAEPDATLEQMIK